eukprot:g1976.t1
MFRLYFLAALLASAAAVEENTIAMIFYDNFEVLDVYGPMEMFLASPVFKIVSCGDDDGKGFRHRRGGDHDHRSSPETRMDYSLKDCPITDNIFIPGGGGVWWGNGEASRRGRQQPLIDWLKERASAKTTKRIMSVCSGAQVLAAAGLLQGLQATSNKNLMKRWNPAADGIAGIDWQYDKRWVVARSKAHEGLEFWTSSGVSAGIDMALTLIDSVRPGAGDFAANYAEYHWKRSAEEDRAPWSITLAQLQDIEKRAPGAIDKAQMERFRRHDGSPSGGRKGKKMRKEGGKKKGRAAEAGDEDVDKEEDEEEDAEDEDDEHRSRKRGKQKKKKGGSSWFGGLRNMFSS